MAKRGKLTKIKTVETIERPVRCRNYRYYILIVCEDQKTEPYYFNNYKELFLSLLPKDTIFLKPVGSGRNSLGVVRYAEEQRDILLHESGKEVDQTWAVFDKDDLDQTEGNRRNFEDSFKLGIASKIDIAYSNECFELWLLLHFEDVDASIPLSRGEIYKRLEDAIKREVDSDFVYKHGDSTIVNIVWEKGDKTKAIERAKKLDEYHKKIQNEPIESNPNTLVYKLVQELESWYKYYSYSG